MLLSFKKMEQFLFCWRRTFFQLWMLIKSLVFTVEKKLTPKDAHRIYRILKCRIKYVPLSHIRLIAQVLILLFCDPLLWQIYQNIFSDTIDFTSGEFHDPWAADFIHYPV